MACKPADKAAVLADYSAYVSPIEVKVTPGLDLGEMEVSVDMKEVTVSLTNTTTGSYTGLSLILPEGQNYLKYFPSASGARKSPGYGGTCGSVLAAKATCTFKLSFTAVKEGKVNLTIGINYVNYIKGASTSFNITALIGPPADLQFTSGISTYNLGVVEQVDAVTRKVTVEIKNNGVLTARNLNFVLGQADAPNDAFVQSSNCPLNLAGQKKCEMVLQYTPKNTNGSDSAVTYNGNLTIDYKKNPVGLLGKLSASFNFLSTRLEADFTPDAVKNLAFLPMTAGNKDTKELKIQNIGYRSGVIKSLLIGNDVECIKAASGNKLRCQINGVDTTLLTFPFVIEDLNSCLDRSVVGVVGKASGETCTFNVTYWTSTNIAANGMFFASDVFVKYDSFWKGEAGTIISKKVATIPDVAFYAVGKLAFDHVEVTPPGMTKLPNIMPDPSAVLEADIGTIPLFQSSVNTNTTYYQVKLFFKNIGQSTVKVKLINDLASTAPLQIIPGVTGTISKNFYYKITQSSCDNVVSNANCIIVFNLAPTAQASAAIENDKMFDFVDSLMPILNYKGFRLSYNDGSNISDTGLVLANKTIETKIKSRLERNGFLNIESPASITYTATAGQSKSYTVRLRNIGTGTLMIPAASNLFQNPPTGGGVDWSLRFIDNPGDPENCGIFNAVDKTLAPTQTCTVSLLAQMPETSRIPTYGNYYDDIGRSFVNQGERTSTVKSTVDYYFKYHPLASSPGVLSDTNKMKATAQFTSEAYIVPQKPLPLTSAVLYRPAISYTALSVTYPSAITKAALNTTERYYDANTYPYTVSGATVTRVGVANCPATITTYIYEDCYNKFFKAPKSMIYVHSIAAGAMPRTAGEYILHGGTFLVGETSTFSLSFKNVGMRPSSSMTLVPDFGPASPISVQTVIPASLTSKASSLPIKFNFTPTAAGRFYQCYNLNYNSYIAMRTTRFCVYAEAVDPSYLAGNNKLVKIEYSDDFSTFTDITSTLNNVDDSKYASFFTVDGSGLTLKKRFKITNTRTTSITKLNVNLLASGTSSARNLTGAYTSNYVTVLTSGLTPATATPVCTADMTLASGASCVIDIRYAPTAAEGLIRNYVGVIFEVSSNQYLSYTGAVSFRNAPPTKLSLVNTTFQNPLTAVASDIKYYDSATDTITPRVGSFGVSINKDPAAPKKNPYVLTNADISNIFEYRVVNGTDLKTSFMPAWKLLNPAASFPVSDTDILISSSPSAEITANRACFFGDDEGDPAVPYDFKGFNKDSQNICKMKIAFKGYRTFSGATCGLQFMGGTIDKDCNPFSYSLLYSTTEGVTLVNSDFLVHMQGYMQPNGINADLVEMKNVTASSSGSVRIGVPLISPVNSNRGSIQVGLLCYDKDYLKLKADKIYELINDYTYSSGELTQHNNLADIENCLPFTDMDEYVNVSGLTKGTYYFFKVFALRHFSNGVDPDLTYLSDSTLPIVTAVIPTAGQVYNHEAKQVIDTSFKPATGIRSAGIDTCAQDYTIFEIVGVNYQAYKNLINSVVFKYLDENPDVNENYPVEGIGAVTHWLSDNAYDISSSISLYDGSTVPGFENYNLAVLDGTNENYKASYHQQCGNNPSCSMLYKLVGGDPGEGLYYEGVFYTTADGASAAIRCYRDLLCPTNPQLSINSASCLPP